MTYKGTNWTRGELGHGVPDPNPSIPCAECSDEYRFQDYWKPRYVEPEDATPREDTWLCDECKDWERRREENHAVTEWVA